jgi:hypothetical protein
MSILITLEHAGVMKNIVGYRSLAGWYGITGIFNLLDVYDAITLYQKISPLLFIATIGFAAWKCYNTRSLTPPQVILAMLLLLMFIPTFGPGYSPPYILWFLPLIIMLYAFATRGLKRLLVISWIIAMLTYITEYAFFRSHGAFLTTMFPTESIMDLSNTLSGSRMQVIIRLPLFLFYILLFFATVKYLRRTTTMPQPAFS